MGVYWNPSNTSYYRSLEQSARNVYLATQGTSGPQSVRTPTGINYVVPETVGGSTSGQSTSTREAPDPRLAAALAEAGAGGNITMRKLKECLLAGRPGCEGPGALEKCAASLTSAEQNALRDAIDAGLFKHRIVREKAEQLANGGTFSLVGIRLA